MFTSITPRFLPQLLVKNRSLRFIDNVTIDQLIYLTSLRYLLIKPSFDTLHTCSHYWGRVLQEAKLFLHPIHFRLNPVEHLNRCRKRSCNSQNLGTQLRLLRCFLGNGAGKYTLNTSSNSEDDSVFSPSSTSLTAFSDILFFDVFYRSQPYHPST